MGKRVLVVSEIFWPEGGGAELATYLILRLLREASFEITVVTGTRKPAKIRGVQFYYTKLLGNQNRVERFARMRILAETHWFKELMRNHDILYVPLMAYPLIPIAKKHGLKVIVHLHNYVPVRYYGVKYVFENTKISLYEELKNSIAHELALHPKAYHRLILMPLSFALYRLSRLWLNQADIIICVSKRQAKIIESNLPSLKDKIKVVYNPPPPLPHIEKKLDENTITLLYVGGKNYIKGYHILLKAIAKLSKLPLNKKITFILTGPGFNTRKRIVKDNVEVKIMGYVPRKTLFKLHEKAHALIFPSICEEPLPYAILEAIMLKTIPIAPKVGIIHEIVDDSKRQYPFLLTQVGEKTVIEKILLLSSVPLDHLLMIVEKMRKFVLEKLNNAKNKILYLFNVV